MSDEEYTIAIGRLVRLKVFLKPTYHEAIDEVIEALVNEAEKL